MDAPVLGAQDTSAEPSKWQISTSWRYQRSDRHFRGIHEEPNRKAEGSEVINSIHVAELGLRYSPNNRWNFSLGIPYFMADRSGGLRMSGQIIGRTTTHSSAIGDISLSARHLLLDPEKHVDGNIAMSFGVKLPTGPEDVYDTRQRVVNGQIVEVFETVDQSIQPGDGGFGFVVGLESYRRIGHGGNVLYFSGSYLVNPKGTNGVPTFRGGSGEAIMSVADQYVARAGWTYSTHKWNGFGVALGGRIEGVPVHDLVGSSEGFRRPGYAVSIEPSISYSYGPHTFSLSHPIAIQRNRQRSVPDLQVPGRIGDAAFADGVLLVGYWRRF